MRVIDMRPDGYTAMSGARTLALFDLEMTGGVRLYNILYRELPGGEKRVVAPNAMGKRSATFDLPTAREITRLAGIAYSNLKAGASFEYAHR